MNSKKDRALNWQVYSIIDKSLLGAKDSVGFARAIFKNGVKAVQFRCKNAPSYKMLPEARKIARLSRRVGADFLINDRPDVALASGASGVHSGYGDLGCSVIKKILGKRMILGKTVHTHREMKKTKNENFDYISAGPVFRTPLKRRLPEKGIRFIKKMRCLSRKPLLGIGGINEKNVCQVLAAGADGACLARGSFKIKKILKAIK